MFLVNAFVEMLKFVNFCHIFLINYRIDLTLQSDVRNSSALLKYLIAIFITLML